jgi:purine-binding chemotaxis protein CheW
MNASHGTPAAASSQAPALAGKYLTFHLAGESYGLPILKVQEIIRLMKITRVPKAPGFVLGVVNLRGKVIPIINMRRKFGLEAVPDTERTCIIVVQIANGRQNIVLGVVVDEVSEVMDLNSEQLSKTPPMGAGRRHRIHHGHGAASKTTSSMLLDLDKAFSTRSFPRWGLPRRDIAGGLT